MYVFFLYVQSQHTGVQMCVHSLNIINVLLQYIPVSGHNPLAKLHCDQRLADDHILM